MLKSKVKCQFDLVIESYSSPDEKYVHDLIISPSLGSYNDKCMHRQTVLKIKTQNVDSNDMYIYMSKLWNFSAMACMIMCFVIYNMILEDVKFINSIQTRYWGMAPHGTESLTYGSKFSLYSMVLMFLINFSISLI